MCILFSFVHASCDTCTHDRECMWGDSLVRLRIGVRFLILLDLVLGITFSIIGPSYILFILSLAFLFGILILSASFRYHETIYLFVYSILICIPFNLRVTLMYANFLLNADVNSLQAWSLSIVASIVLVSVEELILCLIGYLLWGEQDSLK